MPLFDRWTVAYRKKQTDYLPDDTKSTFHCIKNTWRYWRGDPHLAEYDGRIYLFAEMYDRILRRGVIGCCEIREEGATPWTVVLKESWHLSYPHVFRQNGKFYMIPESYVGDQISLYEAELFPWKWRKIHTIKDSYVAVDSTRFEEAGQTWLITLQFKNEHEYLRLFRLSDDSADGEGTLISEDDPNRRPGGMLIRHNGGLIRPAQDCTESYGCALNFYEVTELSDNRYDERLLAKIKPQDVTSDFIGVSAGIHTYNASENYEVIDIKDYEFDVLFYIMRPFWYIWRRVKKVFRK